MSRRESSKQIPSEDSHMNIYVRRCQNPSNFIQLDTHPLRRIKLDTHVVHFMKEGRQEDSF
jgi:hypothetical protein